MSSGIINAHKSPSLRTFHGLRRHKRKLIHYSKQELEFHERKLETIRRNIRKRLQQFNGVFKSADDKLLVLTQSLDR